MLDEEVTRRNLCSESWSVRAGLALLLALASVLVNPANAATKIFVGNNTGHTLIVTDINVSGSKISNKAWKRVETKILPGEHLAVLAINRTGKFNWMDPTPRYVEPGKTVIFNSNLVLEGMENNSPLTLVQKILGTGSGSKMWYRLQGATQTFEWSLESKEFAGIWQPDDNLSIGVVFRSYKENKDTHVEYIVSEEK